jgi:hypothetical protein
MKKILQIFAAAIFCALSAGAVPVSPIQNPHVTFVNGAGLPCAGCKLSTFAAGSTTPLATYVDSSGTTMNANPVVLDASGGAFIWVGSNSYKFILKDALGSTIWSVDNVNAGNLFPCGAAGAVQISSGSSGLACDANITINTTTHTLSIGTLGANYVTIGALSTPTTWTLDTSTPASARASLGVGTTNPGTINQLGYYAAAGSTLSGTSAIPAGITGTTQSPSDNSTQLATTAYVALPGAINPTSVQVASGTALTGNQGDGVLVQHSTGTTTTGHGAMYDASGNVVDAGSAYPVGTPRTCNTNGCYQIDGDGTIRAWGTLPSSTGGTGPVTTFMSFPTAFTATPVLVVSGGEGASGTNAYTIFSTGISTVGATVVVRCSVNIGGSGCSSTGALPINWIAIGQ